MAWFQRECINYLLGFYEQTQGNNLTWLRFRVGSAPGREEWPCGKRPGLSVARVPKGFYTAPGKPLKSKGEIGPISGVSKDFFWNSAELGCEPIEATSSCEPPPHFLTVGWSSRTGLSRTAWDTFKCRLPGGECGPIRDCAASLKGYGPFEGMGGRPPGIPVP